MNWESDFTNAFRSFPERYFSIRYRLIILSYSQIVHNNEQSGVADRREADDRLGAVSCNSLKNLHGKFMDALLSKMVLNDIQYAIFCTRLCVYE